MLKEWLRETYNETRKMWESHGKDENGYAIFYSPAFENPEIMIIGYNPGGDKTSVNRDVMAEPPLTNEYINANYKLAKNIRKVFEYADLKNELKNTVKLNLIFFRSKKASGIKDPEIINFCYDKVKFILEKLNPKILLIEGLGTYKIILNLLGIKQSTKTDIILKGVIKFTNANDLKVIGLKHPSGSWGLTEEMLKQMGIFIGKQYNNSL
jgi:hypothetical protein